MKIKRSFYYGSVLAGAILLILSSAFDIPELSMALGFALLMTGLYGLTLGSGAPDNNGTDANEKIQDRGQGSDDR